MCKLCSCFFLFSLSVIELVPRTDQYPPEWDAWPVQHQLDEQFKVRSYKLKWLLMLKGYLLSRENVVRVTNA
jgi:hypothetical protein